MTTAFPKGLNIHPLSMLLINARAALALMQSNKPFLYWRSYHLFLFWVSAIYETSHLRGFKEKISGKKNIVDRLRDSNDFAGAMFEVLMAFCLQKTSLFDVIAFGDDPPDLLLVSKTTSQRYALECKMLSGLTENQRNMKKLGDAFCDRVMGYLRKEPLYVFVWWLFDRIPNGSEAAIKAAKIAVELCQAERKQRGESESSQLSQELGEGLGRLIVCDLPQELMLSEDKTGDPKPPLNWRPHGVPDSGELYYDRQTQLVNGEIMVSARIALHLTQPPSLKGNLTKNLDYARKQLRRSGSIENKNVAVIGLRTESYNRFKEVISILSEYLMEHEELAEIITAISPTSAYACALVECSDFSRIGLNSPLAYLSSVSRSVGDGNFPFREVVVQLLNEKQIITAIR
jgi:hypothetical protein